jgi:hypothetical protein
VLRGLRLNVVHLNFNNIIPSDALKDVVEKCFGSVTTLRIENIKSTEASESLVEIVPFLTRICTGLNAFEYIASDAEPIMFVSLTEHFPALTKLTVRHCPRITSPYFRGVTRCCKQLCNLQVVDSGLTSEGLTPIFENCTKLQSLMCKGGSFSSNLEPALLYARNLVNLEVPRLDSASIAALALHCTNLQSLAVMEFCDASADSWRGFFTAARCLEKLLLFQCDTITLEELSIPTTLKLLNLANSGRMTDDAVRAIVRNNPLLEFLSVLDAHLTHGVVLPLLSEAPRLQLARLRNVNALPGNFPMERLLECAIRKLYPQLKEVMLLFVEATPPVVLVNPL